MGTKKPKPSKNDINTPPTKKVKNLHDLHESKIDATLEECKPYKSGQLRKIDGYYLTRFAFVKGRWLKKKLRDVYQKEFGISITDEVIAARKLSVNGKLAPSPDVILKSNFYIESTIHFHEKPVAWVDKIDVVYEDDDVVVANKPGSMPVHPSGCFRHNSLQYMLARDRKENFKIIHRLDAITSGIVMLGKTTGAVSTYSKEIREKRVKKTYLARVIGKFPDGSTVCTKPIFHCPAKGAATTSNLGKYSKTTFTKLFEDTHEVGGKTYLTSVLKVEPRTGRTHQIRVHLQSLGFPIVNDPIYNSPGWGPRRFKENGVSNDDSKEALPDNCAKGTVTWDKTAEEQAAIDSIPQHVGRESSKGHTSHMNGLCVYQKDKLADRVIEDGQDATCWGCMEPMDDPRPEELILYLHAQQYEVLGHTFTAPPPSWAIENTDFYLPEFYVTQYLSDYTTSDLENEKATQ